jgi:hypothetical protein
MDDLYIKLIANTKKLNQPADTNPKTLTSSQVSKLFQILEKHYMCYDSVSGNIKEFSNFLERNANKIVTYFEKSISGKYD